jgi:hypothetical protein
MCCFHVLLWYLALGNIGGLMGIFLGASLLSLIELVEFFILLLKSENKLKTPKTSPKQKDMTLLGTEKGATECIPIQQQTGNDSKRVGGMYTGQRKL